MNSRLQRIRDRKVVQWALAWVTGSWLTLEAIDFAADTFGWPGGLVRLGFALAAVGLPVVVVLAWYHGDKGQQRVSGAELTIIATLFAIGGLLLANLNGPPARSPPGFDRDVPSVAVLPFETLGSAGAEDERFADGMHDELLHRLAQIGGLRVTSRTSVLGIREQMGLSRDIARALGVRHLVEGTAQLAGNQVRIIVQLIEPETDDHVWSETFTRTLTIDNLFALQSEISSAIATRLAAELTPSERERLGDHPTQSLSAYQAYQRGNQAFALRFQGSNRNAAAAAYREAIELDPGFTDAHARLARTLLLDFWFQAEYETLPEIESEIRLAAALDSTRAEVHMARGDWAYYTARDYESARAHYARALELQPGDAGALAQTGLMTARAGDPAAGMEILDQALQLDPRSAYYVGQKAFFATGFRQPDESRRYAELAIALDPGIDGYRNSAVSAELAAGDTAAARAAVERFQWSSPTVRATLLRSLAYVRGDLGGVIEWIERGAPADPVELYVLGERDQAVAIAREQLERLPDTAVVEANLATGRRSHHAGGPHSLRGVLLAVLGDRDGALRWSSRGADVVTLEDDAMEHVARRYDQLVTFLLLGETEAALGEIDFLLGRWSILNPGRLAIDPLFGPLRGDPRFDRILSEAGF